MAPTFGIRSQPFTAAASRVRPRYRIFLFMAALCAVLLFRLYLTATFLHLWSLRQVFGMSGVDQLWVYDTKYFAAVVGFLAVSGMIFLRLLHFRGAERVVLDIRFQLCAISAAGIVLLPSSILFPMFRHSLDFVAERLVLLVGLDG